MACARPGIAVNALGPRLILVDGETGWLLARRLNETLRQAGGLGEVVQEPEPAAQPAID
jgi:hypothetical protein